MKIRQGFVSNSSSSSFIVKVDDNTKVEDMMISVMIPLEELIDWNISSEEVADKYYEYLYGDDMQTIIENKDGYYDYEIDEVKKMKKLIKDGKTILICKTSNEGSGISAALYDIVEDVSNNDVVITGGEIIE